jgi:hypothetical protein
VTLCAKPLFDNLFLLPLVFEQVCGGFSLDFAEGEDLPADERESLDTPLAIRATA